MPRNARATKQELAERQALLIQLLSEGAKSTQEISLHLGLSYPQTTLILKKMEDDSVIERLPGRQSRKLCYQMSTGPKQYAEVLEPVVDDIGTTLELARLEGRLYVSFGSMIDMAEIYTSEAVYSEMYRMMSEADHI